MFVLVLLEFLSHQCCGQKDQAGTVLFYFGLFTVGIDEEHLRGENIVRKLGVDEMSWEL